MDENQRLAAVTALDEAIDRIEHAQTSADMRAAAEDVFEAIETSVGGGGIMHMVLGRFRERMLSRVEDTDPEKARAEMLPQLRQWRDQMAGEGGMPLSPAEPSALPVPPPEPAPVRDPENRPTRPGCTGGTALLAALTFTALWALAAIR